MLGFGQVSRPRSFAAASAPGNRNADGYDRPVTGLRRLIRHQQSGKLGDYPHPV